MIVLADSVDLTLSLAILWHPSYYEGMTTGTKSAARPRQTKSHPYKALPTAFIRSAWTEFRDRGLVPVSQRRPDR